MRKLQFAVYRIGFKYLVIPLGRSLHQSYQPNLYPKKMETYTFDTEADIPLGGIMNVSLATVSNAD